MSNQRNSRTLVCSRLTAAGRGAIAVVSLKGAAAATVIDDLFRPFHGKPFLACTDRALTYGCWRSTGEDVVVRRVTDHHHEIHCHGGSAAVESIISSLTTRGAVDASGTPMELADHETVEAQWRTEVWQALPHAHTERTASLLLSQLKRLPAAIQEVRTLIEQDNDSAAVARINKILKWTPFGISLTQVPSVVLSGQPNVGKSSLVNAIVGFQRAIVHQTAGTTRDIVSQRTAVDGWPIEITDTAGLREAGGPIEQLGIENARQRIDSAQVVVGVFDASQPWTQEDQANLESIGCSIIVHNKSDAAIPSNGRPDGIETSATTDQGIDSLISAIAATLVPDLPPADAAYCISEKQEQRLTQVRDRLSTPSGETVARADIVHMLEQVPSLDV